jgi:hypothetical protein
VQGAWRGVTVAAVLLLAGFAAGCDKVTGGGWITSSANPLEKATFGFTARCKNTSVDSTPVAVFYDGQLDYHDRGAGIRIHGDVEPDEFVQVSDATCKELEDFLDVIVPAVAVFEGTYRTHPDGRRGDFEVEVTDNGEPAALNGDMFCIELFDLSDNVTHANCGLVQGGNIQIQ